MLYAANIVRRVAEVYLSFGLPGVFELYANAIQVAQNRLDPVRPFDDDHGIGITKIVETQHFELRYGIEPVGVYMVDIEPAVIFIDDDERGAGNLPGVFSPDAGGNTLDQMRLAAAQRAAYSDNFSAPQLGSKLSTKLDGLVGRI